MGRLCDDLTRRTPAQIAAMNRAELMTYVSGFISDLEELGVSGVTIASYVKAVKSWTRFNGIRLDEKVNITESDAKYAEEVVPTPAEVQSLLDHSPLRVKVAISLMAFGGLRSATIGDAQGLDGLKVKDLPEMEVKEGGVTFAKVPTLIMVRKKISKIRKPFDTFAPAQACDYIRQYLEDRARAGEELTLESAVVTLSEYNAETSTSGGAYFKKPYGDHMSTANVSDMLRNALRRGGYHMTISFMVTLLCAHLDGRI